MDLTIWDGVAKRVFGQEKPYCHITLFAIENNHLATKYKDAAGAKS